MALHVSNEESHDKIILLRKTENERRKLKKINVIGFLHMLGTHVGLCYTSYTYTSSLLMMMNMNHFTG